MSNSWTITDASSTVELADESPTRPPHPGQILAMEFMEPLNLGVDQVAEAVALSNPELVEFLDGRSSMTPELALKLAHAFSIEADFWMRLQNHHDLELARRFGNISVAHLPVLHAVE